MTTQYVLGIDPGTQRMGVALWALDTGSSQERLVACFPLVAPTRDPSGGTKKRWYAPERITWLVDRLDENMAALDIYPGITPSVRPRENVCVVVEHLQGRDVHQAPALEMLIVRLRQWARECGFAYQEVSPQQWRRVIRLQGVPRPTKENVAFWMRVIYTDLRYVTLFPIGTSGGIDAIEAAAIGLYALDELRLRGGLPEGNAKPLSVRH